MLLSSPQRHTRQSRTRLRYVGIDEIDSPILRVGLACWQKACLGRRYPARDDIRLRDIAETLHNAVLIRVLGEGADYEFCILGDAVIRAYGVDLQRQKVSDVERSAPSFGKRLRTLFDRIVAMKCPVAVRREAGRDFPEARSQTAEALLLPLGAEEAGIDYVLGFASFDSGIQ